MHAARKLAGLSQSELARRAGVSQPMISAYERGRREPGLSMLRKLVEATGCELSIEVRPTTAHGDPRSAETPRQQWVRLQRDAIVATAAHRGAHNVRLFGSVARGTDHEGSDVDFLVDLDEDATLLDLIGLERELAELLGFPVDVVPARALKPSVAERALSEARPL